MGARAGRGSGDLHRVLTLGPMGVQQGATGSPQVARSGEAVGGGPSRGSWARPWELDRRGTGCHIGGSEAS